MYDRLTDRSRVVLRLAQQEAQRLNHEYTGVEHILLGIAKEGSGTAAHVLNEFDADLAKLRNAMAPEMKPGPDMVTMGNIPQTPRAKLAVASATQWARALGDNYVGTEHLLLGVLSEPNLAIELAMKAFGITADSARHVTAQILGKQLAAVEQVPDKPQREPDEYDFL